MHYPLCTRAQKQLTFRNHLNLYEVITLFHGYYEKLRNNVQRQFVYCIITICCNTLTIKSAFLRKCNLKFCTVTSTKDSHHIPKNQMSVTETLIEINCFLTLREKTGHLFGIPLVQQCFNFFNCMR